MARTERDAWDLASSVGATATMVAAARAVATRRPQPIITDELAEPLVRAVGLDVLSQLASGEIDSGSLESDIGVPRMVDMFAARTRFFDDFCVEATRAGVRQVVIVGSGLDTRAYRLDWPAGTTVYEIDQPDVIAFKSGALSALGAAPTASLETIGVDLREAWPTALQDAGFDSAQPTAWLVEGLLIGYLPPEAEVSMLDSIMSLSHRDSRLAADYGLVTGTSVESREQARLMSEGWRRRGLDMNMAGLIYPGEHTDAAAHLYAKGWATTKFGISDLFAAAGLPALRQASHVGSAAAISFVTALRV
ncbi:SAM-dependent methyltransferase [Mycobacterium sp. 1554424.7]|nr:SAM-dependent methyltransferase [Mycobacterium sp. 1554424.7]